MKTGQGENDKALKTNAGDDPRNVSNVLSEEKRQQVIALGRLGWPLRRIQQETGIRRETARAYLKAAGIAVRPPGGWGRRAPAKPANEADPDPPAPRSAKTGRRCPPTRRRSRCRALPDGSACEPYFELHRTVAGQGTKRQGHLPGPGGQPRFRGALRQRQTLCPQIAGVSRKSACAVIVTPPAEEAQVDYGSGPMVRDPHSGRYRRTRLFVLTLGYSRKAVRLLVSGPARAPGPNSTNERSAGGWNAARSCSIISAKACSADIYDPSLESVVSRHARPLWRRRCLAALLIRIGRGKVEPASAMPRKLR